LKNIWEINQQPLLIMNLVVKVNFKGKKKVDKRKKDDGKETI